MCELTPRTRGSVLFSGCSHCCHVERTVRSIAELDIFPLFASRVIFFTSVYILHATTVGFHARNENVSTYRSDGTIRTEKDQISLTNTASNVVEQTLHRRCQVKPGAISALVICNVNRSVEQGRLSSDSGCDCVQYLQWKKSDCIRR
jgi:hypothetical protein